MPEAACSSLAAQHANRACQLVIRIARYVSQGQAGSAGSCHPRDESPETT
jgi:hypothetical protein